MNRENGIDLYFEAAQEDRLKELRAEAYAPMLEEQVWQRLREIVQDKVRIHTDHFCQSLIALIPAEIMITAVDWPTVLGTAALAAVLSLLTSVAGLPELE